MVVDDCGGERTITKREDITNLTTQTVNSTGYGRALSDDLLDLPLFRVSDAS